MSTTLIRTLAEDCEFVVHSGAVAAGTSDITPSSGVDCAGYDACTFLVHFGAITATAVTSLIVQSSSDDGSSDAYAAVQVSGSNHAVSVAVADADKVFAITVVGPPERYLKLIVDRGTANAVLNGIIAILHHAKDVPITQGATVGSATVVSYPTAG